MSDQDDTPRPAWRNPRLTLRRFSGLDRSGPPPPATLAGAPLNPWTIPNAIGAVRALGIPLFLVLELRSDHGTDLLPAIIFALIAWGDQLDGMAARITGQYSRLGAMLDRPAAALTVAGRKRLEVARALATGPRLLLLDEVMAGLNPVEVDEIVALVRGVAEGGVTVLLIEHVMQAVAALADRAYVLAEGALIAAGTPRQVALDPRVIEAYLGQGASRVLSGA